MSKPITLSGRPRLPLSAVLLRLAAALLLSLATTVLPPSARAQSPAPAAPAAPVIVAPVGQAEDTAQIDVIGSGLALRSATLQPAVAGEVASVAFRAGQRVGAGQVLLRLDDREQRLAVDLAASQADAARRLLARYQATGDSGAVSGSVIDEARSTLRNAEIALAQARVALADRAIVAPFAGVVGLAEVQRGDRVTPDTVLTTLDDRRLLRVAFTVPESYLGRLAVGQGLEVGNTAYPGRRFAGRIAQIDSRVDSVTRNVRVQAEVPNAEDLLRPGMSFQVQLALPGGRQLSVPELALQWGREGAFVWVVRDGRSVRVPVQSLRRLQGQVLVAGALRVGESVVVEGVQRLRDKRPVQVVGNGAAAG